MLKLSYDFKMKSTNIGMQQKKKKTTIFLNFIK